MDQPKEAAEVAGASFLQARECAVRSGQFHEFAEKECARFYAENDGRPSADARNLFPVVGGYAGAVPLLQEGIEKSPDSAKIRYHHGMTLMATGQKSKRRDQLETALRMRLAGSEAQKAQRALGRAG